MSGSDLSEGRVGFIGAGNMAEAIALGLLRQGVLPAERLAASDPSSARRERFASLGVQVHEDNSALARASSVLVLAVKPQVLAGVLEAMAGAVTPAHLVVSICAGVTAARIEDTLCTGARVIRAMPNTPLLVGEGAVALARGANATAEDLERARALFAASAPVVTAVDDEGLIDAVTAVSGNGPAYVFFLVEKMIAAGEAEGLTAQDARALAVQTVKGAAALLEEAEDSPAQLRAKVTSPGGTTQAAIERMEADGVGASIVAAIRRAAERSRELGRARE